MIAKDYWDARYAQGIYKSGYGSYGEQLERKLKWLKGLDIESIYEVGCGDFNFGSNLLELYPNVAYLGYDISDVIIKKNQELYKDYLFTNIPALPGADLTLCIDVLFHVLDDNDYRVLLTNLKQDLRFGKYLAVTAYENEQSTSPHLKIRKFDYKEFGEPIIREIVEENGQLYFYLFKNKLDLSKVTACLLTKESEYPKEVLDNVNKYNFGEVLIGTNSGSPYLKHELFKMAKNDLIYYQDDDCIAPIQAIIDNYQEGMINVSMDAPKIEQYKNTRMTMGLGWGSIFDRKILKNLEKYTNIYGFDALYQRDTEKILTYLVYPQNRIASDHQDLPSAMAPDRLWKQPNHWSNMSLIEERCKTLI